MGTSTVKLHLLVSGVKPEIEYTETSVSKDIKQSSMWGSSQDYYIDLPVPDGWSPVGASGARSSHQAPGGTCAVSLIHVYRWKIHIGTRGWNTARFHGVFYGRFQRFTENSVSISVDKEITVSHAQKDYQFTLNCADLAPDDTWHDIQARLRQPLENTNVQVKLTNSPTDPNTTTPGQYLWVKYSDTTAPTITDLIPAESDVTRNTMPDIMANFNDFSGSGVDINSFSLVLNEGTANRIEINSVSSKQDGLLSLTEQGFLYTPPVHLASQLHHITITIADKVGNITIVTSVFTVDLKAFNPEIGKMPVDYLSTIGKAGAKTYAKVGIQVIGDLVNQDPRNLTKTTTLKLTAVIDHIKRAQIVCSEVQFLRGDFSELFFLTLDAITKMTDTELRAIDITIENNEELQRLREAIALLYVCFDDKVMKKITFGNIIWDQPG